DIHVTGVQTCALPILLASPGYPADYPKGLPITMDAPLDDIAQGGLLFHAGTAIRDEILVTSGGRVLNVTAMGASIPEATQNAYSSDERRVGKELNYEA